MQFSDPNINRILQDINMLTTLKDIHNLVGSREHVALKTVEERLNPNNNQGFARKLKALSQYGYLSLKANRKEDDEIDYENIEVKVTPDGNVVCGFIMSVLLDFHRSQQDTRRY